MSHIRTGPVTITTPTETINSIENLGTMAKLMRSFSLSASPDSAGNKVNKR